MPLVIDGNNLLHRLSGGASGRAEVRRLALELVRRRRTRLTVVFDGPPPPGAPEREELGRATVRYSCPRSADDVIVATLPAGRAAAEWTVVTDDRGLAARVRERGAHVISVSAWRERLASSPEPPSGRRAEPPLTAAEVAEWESFFAGRDER